MLVYAQTQKEDCSTLAPYRSLNFQVGTGASVSSYTYVSTYLPIQWMISAEIRVTPLLL